MAKRQSIDGPALWHPKRSRDVPGYHPAPSMPAARDRAALSITILSGTAATGVPAVTTGTATSVTGTSATLTATVYPNGADTVAYFVYGLTTSYTVATTETDVGSGTPGVAMNTPISGLLPGTLYHYEVIAWNSQGVASGSDMTFMTTPAAAAPTVTTGSATSVTDSSATLNATVSPNGADTFVTFQYGLDSTYGLTTTGTGIGSGASTMSVATNIGNLVSGTTYHFRVTGSNSQGVTSGADMIFTTTGTAAAGAPTVTTGSATSMTGSSATLTATVNPNGAATAVYFLYGLSAPNYTVATAEQMIGNGTSAVPVSTPISGLLPGTLFHYEVVAWNSQGVTYGSDMTLMTTGTGLTPAITSATTATGTVGNPFTYTITATNTPTSFSASGFPAWLNVSATSAVLTGTPTASGTFAGTISAINASGTGTANLTITISGTAPGAPVISSSLTATGTVGSPFTYTITATNSPTSFTASGFPAWLNVSATTGVLSGTPTAAGTVTGTISAINASGTASNALSITISGTAPGSPVISSSLTATGTVGSPFTYTITATNSPTSFTASGFPAWLNVSATTGVLSGTPTASGTFAGTISAINASGTGSTALSITIVSSTATIAVVPGKFVDVFSDGTYTNSGIATITVTTKRTFSASVKEPGNNLNLIFTGSFAEDGSATVTKDGVTLKLQIGVTANGHNSISGTVLGINFIADELLVTKTMTPQAYTVRLPYLSLSGSGLLPQGNGYGTLSVGKTAAVHLTGKLGDGEPFTASGGLVANGTSSQIFPLFAQVYKEGPRRWHDYL